MACRPGLGSGLSPKTALWGGRSWCGAEDIGRRLMGEDATHGLIVVPFV